MTFAETIKTLEHRLHGLSAEEARRRVAYCTMLGKASGASFIFSETPKAACSSMKWLLTDIVGRHVEPKAMGIETSRIMCIHSAAFHGFAGLASLTQAQFHDWLENDDVVRFCVVRNPYQRVLSAWANKIRQREPLYRAVWQEIAAHNRTDPQRCPEFPEFLSWLVATQDVRRCNTHWRGMTWLLLPDLLNYNHILRTENLVADLAAVLQRIAPERDAAELLARHHINESLPLNGVFYDEESAAKVYAFYREDFHRFGYAQDSWKARPSAVPDPQVDAAVQQLTAHALEVIRARNDIIEDHMAEAGCVHRFADGKTEPADLLRELSTTLLDQGHAQRARALADASLKLQPDNSATLLVLARCLIELGEPDAARQHLEVARRDRPRRAAAQALLAKLAEMTPLGPKASG